MSRERNLLYDGVTLGAVEASELAAALDGWLAATLSVATIALAILGVALTVFGITIGLIALWGYKGVKDWASDRAQQAAEARLNEALDSEAIKRRIEERVAREADALFPELAMSWSYLRRGGATAPEGQAEQAGNVGEMYPEGGRDEGDARSDGS